METTAITADEERVLTTREFIESGRSGPGGWTRAQLKLLGVPWPPPRGGWKSILERNPIWISKADAEAFLRADRPRQASFDV